MSPVLMVHIGAGAVALTAGAVALLAAKGETVHRALGTVFFLAMTVMGLVGAYVAATLPQRGTIVVGTFVAYLVITAWMTVRRPEGTAGIFERFSLIVAIAITVAFLACTIVGHLNANGRLDSLPAAVHYPFAALAALAVYGDWRVVRHGGISGKYRIVRHLWRMCAALLIAAFSFFLGQQKVMPESWQGSPLLFVPPLAVLALTLFWAVRVRFTKWWRDDAPPPAPPHAPSSVHAKRG